MNEHGTVVPSSRRGNRFGYRVVRGRHPPPIQGFLVTGKADENASKIIDGRQLVVVQTVGCLSWKRGYVIAIDWVIGRSSKLF